MRAKVLLGGLVTALAMACGGGGGNSTQPSPNPSGSGANSTTVTVNIEGDAYRPGGSAAFAPGLINVAVGSTVIWSNKDQTAHTTTANNGSWNGTVSGGGEFSRQFTARGSFEYHCTIHPSMSGTVNVQ